MIPELTAREVDRFHGKVGRGSGCWPWTGETNNKGYGRFSIYRGGRRVRLLAHRVAYKLAYGEDPGPSVLRHRCDNPPCCNPADLAVGTQADNMRDAERRGRSNLAGLHAFRAQRSVAVSVRLAVGVKRCRRCTGTKPFSEFSANISNPDGLQYYCKPCARDVNAAYRLKLRGKPEPVGGEAR